MWGDTPALATCGLQIAYVAQQVHPVVDSDSLQHRCTGSVIGVCPPQRNCKRFQGDYFLRGVVNQ